MRTRQRWGKRSADHRLVPFYHRPADAVRGDGLYFGHRRPAAHLCLDAEPQHARACLLGRRLSHRRRGRGLAGGARIHAQRMVGLRRQCAAVRRLRSDVGRRAQFRRPARSHPAPCRGRGDLDCRLSVRRLRAIRRGAHRPRVRHHGGLRALFRLRALGRSRPRSALALADAVAGRRHAGFLLARIPFASALAFSAAAGRSAARSSP
jgi:hypothetical protein